LRLRQDFPIFLLCSAKERGAGDEVQIMETKGRRGPRTAGPIGTPAHAAKPVAIPAVAAEPDEAPTEPARPIENTAKAAEPEETAPERVTAAATLVSALEPTKGPSPDEFGYFSRDALAALAQSQAALARGLEAMSAEMAGLTLSGIDAAARTAAKMLGVKTLSDAIDINAGFACSSLNALVGGSAKLSELGVKLAAETSQPILTQFGKGWIKASRLGS
jgi:hypothetical protein